MRARRLSLPQPMQNTQGGAHNGGTFDLYGYQIPADPTRTLFSVSVPNNRNVVIMALGFGSNTQVVVPGTYAYTPPSGTVLPVGTDPLSVTFTPTDTGGYTTVSATNSIVVTKATPVLTWQTPAAIAQGTASDRNATRCHRKSCAGNVCLQSRRRGHSPRACIP